MSEKILVVEIDDATRKSISSALTSAGYECQQAADDIGASDLLDSSTDLEAVLLSIPTNPEELLVRIKSKHPDTPVVVVTSMHDISVAQNAIRNGAYDYLLKPFDCEQLLTTVRRALENRRLKLENRAYQTNLEVLVTARTEQLRQAVSTLEKSYDIAMEVLCDTLGLKDAEAEDHSKRTTAFTIALARAMGFSTEQIRIIGRGAFLHDIGKMTIPDKILHKPGRLDLDEWAIMREHCARGYRMVQKAIPFFPEAAEIVRTHHENFDGTGYPRGLKGDEIPLGAKIVAVANTLDAITSDRPYRAGPTHLGS
jgi:putative nucleotidyltransferase with HDIG domain